MHNPLWLKEKWGTALSFHFDFQTYNNIKSAPQRFDCGEIWFVIIMVPDLFFFLPKPHGLKFTWLISFPQSSTDIFFLQVFLIFLPVSRCSFCPYLFLSHCILCLSSLPLFSSLSLFFSLCVFLTLSAQVCWGLEQEEEKEEEKVGGVGGSPVVYPAEPPSPGVRMTGSQPDGTEQVCSMWPPLWRGRKQGGEEEEERGVEWGGGVQWDYGKEVKRWKKDVRSGADWASHISVLAFVPPEGSGALRLWLMVTYIVLKLKSMTVLYQ